MSQIVSADIEEILAAASVQTVAAHSGPIAGATRSAMLPGAQTPSAVTAAVSAVDAALADVARRFAEHARRTAAAAHGLDDADHGAARSITSSGPA